jgi:hypothetical protein
LLLFYYGECQRKLSEKTSFSGRNEENRQETNTEAEYKSSGPVLAVGEGRIGMISTCERSLKGTVVPF